MVNGKELLKKSIRIEKEHKLETGSVLSAMAIVYAVKEIHKKRRKEKGVPENYENDIKGIVNECDYIIEALWWAFFFSRKKQTVLWNEK